MRGATVDPTAWGQVASIGGWAQDAPLPLMARISNRNRLGPGSPRIPGSRSDMPRESSDSCACGFQAPGSGPGPAPGHDDLGSSGIGCPRRSARTQKRAG